jgi:capsid protein
LRFNIGTDTAGSRREGRSSWDVNQDRVVDAVCRVVYEGWMKQVIVRCVV